jgi:hypothetical protein
MDRRKGIYMQITQGYCWLHDCEYSVIDGDEVCPQCLKNKERDIEWRNQED